MRRGSHTLSTAALLAIAVMSTGADSREQATSPAMFVPVYVTATDSNGRDVTSFSRPANEMSAVVLLDTSISSKPNLGAMFEVALEFFSQLRPADRAVVRGFGEQPGLSKSFTSNRDELITQLKALSPINRSPFFDAIVASADALKGEPGRHVLFVLTDGDDTASRSTFGNALDSVQARNVMVYSGGVEQVLQIDRRVIRSRPNPRVKRLAEETGGRYFEVTESTQRVDVRTARVLDDLHSYYMLTFAPSSLNGTRQKLEIATSRPEVSLRARKNYMARP
jgi:VWFA-related protein